MKTPKVIKVKKVVEKPSDIETLKAFVNPDGFKIADEQVVDTSPEYVICVTIEQETYCGKGITALEALKAIPVPHVISTGLVVVTHGDKRKEMLYPTMQLKRIFNIYHQETLINDIIWGMS